MGALYPHWLVTVYFMKLCVTLQGGFVDSVLLLVLYHRPFLYFFSSSPLKDFSFVVLGLSVSPF